MKKRIFASGKLFDRIKARLRRKNREFKKLSLREQRIKIAKDVISMIDVGLIRPASTYIRLPVFPAIEHRAKLDMSEVIAQLPSCEVCGIGSLFVSAVTSADVLKFSDFDFGDDRNEEVRYLSRWFSEDQLWRVENYYEDRRSVYSDGHGHSGDSHVSPILCRHPKNAAETRMKMIMENIVSNRGRFDPLNGKHKRIPVAAALAAGLVF